MGHYIFLFKGYKEREKKRSMKIFSLFFIRAMEKIPHVSNIQFSLFSVFIFQNFKYFLKKNIEFKKKIQEEPKFLKCN